MTFALPQRGTKIVGKSEQSEKCIVVNARRHEDSERVIEESAAALIKRV